MREQFRGYYAPTSEELRTLWESATIVFDANVLLDFHRYRVETSTTYLELASVFAERLWLPFQAAFEYHESRIKVRSETTATHKEQITSIEKLINVIGQSPRKSHLTAGEKHKALLSAAQDLLSELKEESSELADRNSPAAEDHVLAKITSLYEGKVGDEPSEDSLKKLYGVASERFARKIPPGYMDQSKDGDRKYGDYILWQQVLDYAKESQTDVILVTEDAKEDWWVSVQGKQVMPRPELVKEFRAFTNGRSIHLYNGLSFFNHASRHAQNVTTEGRIEAAREELEDVAKQRVDDQTLAGNRYSKWLAAKRRMGTEDRLQSFTFGDALLEPDRHVAIFQEIEESEARLKALLRHIGARDEAGTEPDDPSVNDLNLTRRALEEQLRELYRRTGMSRLQQDLHLWQILPRNAEDEY
ncbi:PIN domain-containing protein [Paenarthrobacter ilicis]|uniref:PIN-like domain-containing protein n=1 Tax=Paenarthrobacter ilicis TaxID=43665 RepID=UPI003009A963